VAKILQQDYRGCLLPPLPPPQSHVVYLPAIHADGVSHLSQFFLHGHKNSQSINLNAKEMQTVNQTSFQMKQINGKNLVTQFLSAGNNKAVIEGI
jgi:hypothetical protein